MHLALLPFLILLLSSSSITTASNVSKCYTSPLPSIPTSVASENRSIPWGQPSLILPNGTKCCDGLTQVRDGIDGIDLQFIQLLALRAAYVREATRFKARLEDVDVPSRDAAVIESAVNASRTTNPRLPETIAKGVFEAVLNFSVPFEECVFAEFCG